MTSVKGYAYLCPANCHKFEDDTSYGYSQTPEITAPATEGDTGSVVAFLLGTRSQFAQDGYSQGTAYLHDADDAYECSADDTLDWSRSSPSAIAVTYKVPQNCNWISTTVRPAVPPDYGPGSASFPNWTWEIDREYPNGYLVQPDYGDEETKEKAYTPIGQTVSETFGQIFLAPGTYVAALESINSPGGGARERMLTKRFATKNITGGIVVSNDGDLDYTVDIFDQEYIVKASDYRDWDPGDWVFVAPNLCSGADHPGNSECTGDPASIELYGSADIFDPDPATVSLMIIPIQLGALGPAYPISIIGLAEWGAFLEACIMRATIISVNYSYNYADIEIDGVGRKNNVPIIYIGRNKTTPADGRLFFGPGQEALVFNKSGKSNPSTDEIVIFHACRPISPVLYFFLNRTKMAFLWDTETNDFPVGVTNGAGEPITSWPVSWLDLQTWMGENLEQKSTTNTVLWDVPKGDYCSGDPCTAGSFGDLQLVPYMDPLSQDVDDVCAGPSSNYNTCDWKDHHGTKFTNYSKYDPGYWVGDVSTIYGANGLVDFGKQHRTAWSADLSNYENFTVTGQGTVLGDGLDHCFWGGTDPVGTIPSDRIVKTQDIYYTRNESAPVVIETPGNLYELSGDMRQYDITHRQTLWYWSSYNPLTRYILEAYRQLDDETHETNYQILCTGLTSIGWNSWAKLIVWAYFDSGATTEQAEVVRDPDASNFDVQCLQGDISEGITFENLNPFTTTNNAALAAAVKELMLNPVGETLTNDKLYGSASPAALIQGITVCMPGTGGNFIMPTITLYDWK